MSKFRESPKFWLFFFKQSDLRLEQSLISVSVKEKSSSYRCLNAIFLCRDIGFTSASSSSQRIWKGCFACVFSESGTLFLEVLSPYIPRSFWLNVMVVKRLLVESRKISNLLSNLEVNFKKSFKTVEGPDWSLAKTWHRQLNVLCKFHLIFLVKLKAYQAEKKKTFSTDFRLTRKNPKRSVKICWDVSWARWSENKLPSILRDWTCPSF